ncbi:Dabb family protein [Oerskovia sp. M15]
MTDARVLATIPGVERFEQLRQTSAKNAFTFGFSMEFVDAAAYTAYDQHPDHQGFVAAAGSPRSRTSWRSTTSRCRRPDPRNRWVVPGDDPRR